MKSVLMTWGGWDGHEPKQCSEKMAGILRAEGVNVEISDSLDCLLNLEKLKTFDLVIPCWTMSELSADQTKNLSQAVMSGTGLAGWHGGMCDSFRNNCDYQFITGGQFVAHPGGFTDYQVNITNHEDQITANLEDFKMHSEQYYMHVDPSNEVLATTTIHSDEMGWIDGCVMPVVWKRMWGKGRVFYSSLGHIAAEFDIPELKELMKRGALWALK